MWQRSIISFLFPFVLILLNANALLLNQPFYEKELQKHNIYTEFETTQEEIDLEVETLLGFLKGKNELTTTFFNEKEKLHLFDVKNLISRYKLITLVLTLILLSLIIYTKDSKAVKQGCINTIMVGIMLIFLSVTIFSQIFTLFHQVSFSNDLWLLNPEIDNLIKLFPEVFFYDFFSTIIRNTIIAAGGIFIGIKLSERYKQKVYKKQKKAK